MTPGEAIRKHCVDCVGSVYETENCKGYHIYTWDGPCPFYPYRQGKGRPSVKLIRKMCRYCMSSNQELIRNCNSEYCTLVPFRMGKNPNYDFEMTNARKRAMDKLIISRQKGDRA